MADCPLYRQHWLLFVSVHANTILAELVTSTNETHYLANLPRFNPYFGRHKYKKHKPAIVGIT